MQKIKLFRLLMALSEYELNRFHKFLQSPFHNSNKNVLKLFRILKYYHPHLNSSRIQKEKIYFKVFSEKKFNQNKWRKLLSTLSKLIESFLLNQYLENEELEKKKMLNKIFQQRNLHSDFLKNSLSQKEDLNQHPYRDRTYHSEQHFLNWNLYFQKGTEKSLQADLLDQAMIELDYFYMLSKLQLKAEIQNRVQIWSESFQEKLTDEIEQLAQQTIDQKNHLLFQIYLNILQLPKTELDLNHLEQCVSLFQENNQSLRKHESKKILQHLFNYCIKFLNRGHYELKNTLFQLYHLGLKLDILFDNKQVSEISFSNICSLGLSLNHVEWTEQFILKYGPLLPMPIREETIVLCQSLVYFQKEEYDEVLKYLHQQNFKDIRNTLKSRCLTLRTYFEQYEEKTIHFDFLMDNILAFEKYLKRNSTLSQEKLLAYLNFVKFIKKIAKSYIENKPSKKINDQIETTKEIVYKSWLLQKCKNGH